MSSPVRTPPVGLGAAAWGDNPSTTKARSRSGSESPSPPGVNSGRFSDLPPRPPKVPMDSGTGGSVQQTQRRGSAPAAMQAAAQGMDPWMQGGAQFQRRGSAPAAMQTTPQEIAHNLMWGAGSGRPQAPVGSQPPHAQAQSTYAHQRPATAPPGAPGRIATSGHGNGYSTGKAGAGGAAQSTAATGPQGFRANFKAFARSLFSSNSSNSSSKSSGRVSSDVGATTVSPRRNSRQEDINEGHYGISSGGHQSNDDESFLEGKFGPR